MSMTNTKKNQPWTVVESRKDKKLRKQKMQEQERLEKLEKDKPLIDVVVQTEEQKQISLLQKKIQSLEQRVDFLEKNQPQPCPKCQKCVEPVIKITTDRWTGCVGRRFTMCPSCEYVYYFTF
jgi:hypothetical protein